MADKVHHVTRRAADKDLAEGTITAQSHAAVISGNMTLQEARNIGADDAPTDTPEDHGGPRTATEGARSASAEDHQDAPPQPVSRISKDDATQECWCGCGQWTKPNRMWVQGHDMRAHRIAREYVRGEREISKQMEEYLVSSGKLEKARQRVEKEREKKECKAEHTAKAKAKKENHDR
jgi:hypothetical protein